MKSTDWIGVRLLNATYAVSVLSGGALIVLLSIGEARAGVVASAVATQALGMAR